MGGFSLTNPALQYPGQAIDPTTGQPIQAMPHVQFFKNVAARAKQFAADAAAQSQPSTSTVDGSVDGQPVTGEIQPPAPVMPKMFKPSFAQTTTTSQGLPAPLSPAQTKLGKLVAILGAAAQGGIAGLGTGNPGAGAAAAREVPFQQAQQRQQLERELLENQQVRANLPLSIAKQQAAIAQVQAQTKLATEGVAGGQFQPDSNGAGYRYQPTGHFGQPVGPGMSAIPPALLRPKIKGVTVMGDDGRPRPATQNLLTGEVMDETGQVIPNPQIFEGAMVPKSTTETGSVDLMGNSSSRRTVAPVLPANTSGGRTATPGQRPVNMVQRTAGGPLVAQTASGSSPRPTVNANAPAGSPAQTPLPPDVEQRLSASRLKPLEQAYVRGLLNYQGQMPSPRSKNYASTLATLTQIDPSFNAGNYDAIRKTLSDYTPGGKVGSQVLAFNTGMRHIGLLSDAVDALNNGKLQIANKFGNALSVQLGKDPVTNFNTIKTYLAGELAKGFGGGVATDSSREEANSILSQIQSPEQIKGGLAKAVDLLRGKIGAQEDAYQKTVGKPISLLDGQAHKVLQKLGMEQPAGATHIVPGKDGRNHYTNETGTVDLGVAP